MVVQVLLKPSMRISPRLVPSVKFPTTNLVLTEEIGDKGVLIFNRPKALNAVNSEMAYKFAAVLNKWRDTKSLIIVKGNGGKAFCAGGDVREMVKFPDGMKKIFQTEYTKVFNINNLKIPYIALIDGITMGDGVGMSIHGRYQIATEKTVFAMPENVIGLFPDVGGSYFLPRLQAKLGYYLGLTGSRLKGADVFYAGLATHYCESAKIPKVEKALLDLKNTDEVGNLLNDLCPKPNSEFVLSKNLGQIKNSFSAPTMEEILSNLEEDNSEWAKQTIKTLRTVSPTSLKVCLHMLNLGANFSLGEYLQMEYRLAVHLVENSDFHEGVRALLITKDNNPKWNPSCIEDVTEDRVLSFFRPLPDNENLPINVKLRSKLT